MRAHANSVRLPPDGGWGWLIVLGSSVVNFCTRAIEPSFGLLFGGLLRELNAGTTGAAVVMSTRDFSTNFSGFFVGPLVKKLSYRKVAIIGGLFTSVAFLTVAFANSMTHLLLAYGVLGGFGFGFVQASAFVGLNNYFLKRRGQAVGLALAGTAIGFMTMPQIVSFLVQNYDFRGALMIVAAISLNSLVGASLFQPVEWHMKTPAKHENGPLKLSVRDSNNDEASVTVSLLDITKEITMKKAPLLTQRQMSIPAQTPGVERSKLAKHRTSESNIKRKLSSASSNVSIITGSTTHVNGSGTKMDVLKKKKSNKKDAGCWSRFYGLMDFSLLKDGVYLNILFGLSIVYVAELNFKMIVPFFMDSLGYTLQETAHALSATAVADLAARLIVPPILDRVTCSKRTTLMIAGIFVVIARSALAEQTKTVPLLICFVFHGFFRGATIINLPLVLSEYATQENFPAVLGLSMVSKAIFILVFGPLVGYIRDYTGSYPLCIHVQSLFMLTCIVAWAVEYLVVYLRKKTRPLDDPQDPS